MSHLQFSRAILSREFSRATKLQVWHGESRKFLTVAQLYFRIELCSVLCNSVHRMQNADWCNFIARLCCTLARQNCATKLQVWHRSKSLTETGVPLNILIWQRRHITIIMFRPTKSDDDLDLWHLTLKTISILRINIMNICSEFHWNLITKEIVYSQTFRKLSSDDLALWPVTLKPFPILPTGIINIFGKFHQNCPIS